MRIIGGTMGGQTLRAPRGTGTRPTSDRVREALFSILGPPPPGARVLDLFAGSGALGLEALSRGAESSVFVEKDTGVTRILAENSNKLGVVARCHIIQAPVERAWSRIREHGPFHWVFLDPPYASDGADRSLAALGARARELLADGAVIVVEHDKRNPPRGAYPGLESRDSRRYGETEVSFFQQSTEEQE